jgi:hypothetical protein
VYDNQSNFHGRMKSIEDEKKREHLVNARMDIMNPAYYKISFHRATPIFRHDRGPASLKDKIHRSLSPTLSIKGL